MNNPICTAFAHRENDRRLLYVASSTAFPYAADRGHLWRVIAVGVEAPDAASSELRKKGYCELWQGDKDA